MKIVGVVNPDGRVEIREFTLNPADTYHVGRMTTREATRAYERIDSADMPADTAEVSTTVPGEGELNYYVLIAEGLKHKALTSNETLVLRGTEAAELYGMYLWAVNEHARDAAGRTLGSAERKERKRRRVVARYMASITQKLAEAEQTSDGTE